LVAKFGARDVTRHETLMQMTTTPASIALSKNLKKRGWSFVGPTTMYAFMQATGIVNDHVEGCPARTRCERERRAVQSARTATMGSSRAARPARR
jgi:DNA-3-methyladenine glycosylase I